jgi:hypothetical protein
MNINSINIGRKLWLRPMLARTISSNPNLKPTEAVQQFEKLGIPAGWTREKLVKFKSLSGLEVLVGWLVTAAGTLFGAPFCFDSLERIARVKGTGPSPVERQIR